MGDILEWWWGRGGGPSPQLLSRPVLSGCVFQPGLGRRKQSRGSWGSGGACTHFSVVGVSRGTRPISQTDHRGIEFWTLSGLGGELGGLGVEAEDHPPPSVPQGRQLCGQAGRVAWPGCPGRSGCRLGPSRLRTAPSAAPLLAGTLCLPTVVPGQKGSRKMGGLLSSSLSALTSGAGFSVLCFPVSAPVPGCGQP